MTKKFRKALLLLLLVRLLFPPQLDGERND